MYLIRKLMDCDALDCFDSISDLSTVEADFLASEIKTKKNTLSLWAYDKDSLKDIKKSDSVKALSLTLNKVDSFSFVVFDENDIIKKGLTISDDEPGATGFKNKAKLHRDLKDLTYASILDILFLFKNVSLNDDYIFSVERKDINNYIQEIINNGSIDVININNDLLLDILKNMFNQTYKEIDNRKKSILSLINDCVATKDLKGHIKSNKFFETILCYLITYDIFSLKEQIKIIDNIEPALNHGTFLDSTKRKINNLKSNIKHESLYQFCIEKFIIQLNN